MQNLNKSYILKSLEYLSAVAIDGQFEASFTSAAQKIESEIPSLIHYRYLQAVSQQLPLDKCSSFWKYTYLSLECMLCLKENLINQSDEAESLLSISQQRAVRTLLDRLVTVGVLANLLPGVVPEQQVMTAAINESSSMAEIEKYECLCLVTLALVDLYKNDTFHGIILPQFLSALLRALCQLTMVPLKKTVDTFPRLQRERTVFQQHMEELLTKLHQPMVVKELMIIEGDKKCPMWLKKGVARILTQQLHRPRGVLAILEAVRDAINCAAPTTNAHLESIAQVVTASPHLPTICPQILELIDSNDAESVRVGVLCIRTLWKRDHSLCENLLLQPILKPLTTPPCTEQELSLCLRRLHKCFAVPASDLWCLPPQALQSYIHLLFQLYCKIYQSVSHLRKVVEDLVWSFLSNCDDTLIKSILRCLVYNESIPHVLITVNIEFVFGDDGGIKSIHSEELEHSLEESGDSLMILLERRDNGGKIGNALFVTLLEFASENKELDSVGMLECQLVSVKLLAVLSENTAVQNNLNQNPEPVVKFLTAMINKFISGETRESEPISIVLLVLNVILNDCIYSKKTSWHIFKELETPLSMLKEKAENPELQLLAREVYEVIMTHGGVRPKERGRGTSQETLRDSPRISSSCEEALREARDPLLPVRGHALIQLGKLLATGDKQAKAKKDQILCLFQENMKQEDSFLYLSAIEGLAVCAAEFPDNVIVSLTEQYMRPSLSPNTRLKVGEALVRVTKVLGDLVPVYKAELINAFLFGTKDEDFLVRASSLSNLGELCRVLGFRVGPIVAEVLMCVRSIVSTDPSVEVRRAAVMLTCLLLKGLHKDTFTVLDVLLELYRSLKQLYSSDKDDVVRLHAQLALEELNSGTLAFLFPKPQLEKRIFVLDPPP